MSNLQICRSLIQVLPSDQIIHSGTHPDPEPDVGDLDWISFDLAVRDSKMPHEKFVQLLLSGKIEATMVVYPDETIIFVNEGDVFDSIYEKESAM